MVSNLFDLCGRYKELLLQKFDSVTLVLHFFLDFLQMRFGDKVASFLFCIIVLNIQFIKYKIR